MIKYLKYLLMITKIKLRLSSPYDSIIIWTKWGPDFVSEVDILEFENHYCLHRTNGPAVIYPDGTKIYYQNRKLHRIDGPAVELSDRFLDEHQSVLCFRYEWWKDGKRHRVDGPAIEGDSPELNRYWFQGKELPHKQIERWLTENSIDLSTQQGKTAFKLKWC